MKKSKKKKSKFRKKQNLERLQKMIEKRRKHLRTYLQKNWTKKKTLMIKTYFHMFIQ